MKANAKKRRRCALLSAALLCVLALSACGSTQTSNQEEPGVPNSPAVNTGEVSIVLSDDLVTVDGEAASQTAGEAVYLSHDIIYYEDRDAYDSGNPYGEGTAQERHSAQEAEAHTVVNITQPGTYRLSGSLSQGQIFVDLGEDAKTDPQAVVTLVMDGADVACTVAPAVFFYRVYECDQAWVAYDNDEGEYTPSADQDTSQAGANVVIADGSVNNISGSHVARIYKDNGDQKKLHKYDGAFYSRMSMNLNGGGSGTGVLNIVSDNEGVDSELHLTINGGKVNIQSQDDGINTNEDNVSVTTINGGSLHIVAGLGSEGDGIDSNGYLVINGGVVISTARPQSDSGLDSDCGSYINGGYVVATGSTMDWAESDSDQVTMNLQFAAAQGSGEAIIITDTEGKVVFAYDPDKDETTGDYNRGYQGAVISCPQFQVGETYQVYIGGDVEGVETDGLYDASTVTGFSGAALQQYTGTDVGMGFGRPGGQQRPEDFGPNSDQGREPPEGMDFPGEGQEPPEGFDHDWEDWEHHDGEDHRPGGDGRRPDGEPGQMPGGFVPDSGGWEPDGGGEPSTQFRMADKVNAFSGVADAAANPGSV
ncbi:MAG: carbohydrate-binding domain-containing protein [Oscillospiraceae bacterium]|nr:carbohydrate-binding domain-containing protein [Oscillospiraceae bacterium]